MGLADFLSPMLTVATNAAGTYQGAQAQAAQEKTQSVIQAYMMARQQRQMEIENALKQAQTGEANAKVPYYQARADAALRPKFSAPVIGPNGQVQVYDTSDPTKTQTLQGIQGKPPEPVMGSPEWTAAKIKEAQIGNQYGYHPPVSQYTPTVIVGPDGTQHVGRFNTKTGQLEDTGTQHPISAGAGGGMAARTQAQLETASGQAALADQGMRAYEDKVLSGNANLNPLSMHLARSAIAGSTTAEATLNTLNPELASYVRFAKQVATAERMITPRGGSSAMTNAEALLSGAGASGTPAQIQNARAYRAALIHGLKSHATPQQPSQAPVSTPAANDTPGNIFLP